MKAVLRFLVMLDRDSMTPVRVAIALMLFGGVAGWLVGVGASPWFLLTLPFVAACAISANR